jgi:hypothetical protein
LLNKILPSCITTYYCAFGGLVYNFYRSTKIATQNKLWAGMAKKLPTRLNSALFIDWLGRTLKTENIDESTTFEIEKTLSAQTITDRFLKLAQSQN